MFVISSVTIELYVVIGIINAKPKVMKDIELQNIEKIIVEPK